MTGKNKQENQDSAALSASSPRGFSRFDGGSFERAGEAGAAHPSGEHGCPMFSHLVAEIFSQSSAITARTHLQPVGIVVFVRPSGRPRPCVGLTAVGIRLWDSNKATTYGYDWRRRPFAAEALNWSDPEEYGLESKDKLFFIFISF